MSQQSPALVVAVTLAVMLVPGPSVAYAVSSTLQHGRRAGLWAVAGLETGMLVHVLAASLGLSAVVAASPSTLTAVRVAGATYLGYLGLTGLRAARSATHTCRDAADDRMPALHSRVYRAGVLVDVLNPKSFLFFVALLPPFLGPRPDGGAAHPLVLCGIVVVLATLCDSAYALGADLVRSRRGRRSAPRWLAYLPPTALLGLALVTLAS